MRYVRWGGLLLALVILLPTTLNYRYDTVVHAVNLVFHEAGHIVFGFAGEVVMLLGGSLMQLLVPLACAAAFLHRRDTYAAGLMIMWLGQSLSGVASYVADAKDRNLDLITGDPDTHDFWQLFTIWNALDSAKTVGTLLHVAAFGLLLAGVVLALYQDMQGDRDR